MIRCPGHSRLSPVRIEWNVSFFAPESSLSGGVHHWDENGLRDSEREPKEIRQIHEEMIEFVKVWLKDWQVPSVTKKASYDQSVVM